MSPAIEVAVAAITNCIRRFVSIPFSLLLLCIQMATDGPSKSDLICLRTEAPTVTRSKG